MSDNAVWIALFVFAGWLFYIMYEANLKETQMILEAAQAIASEGIDGRYECKREGDAIVCLRRESDDSKFQK